MNQWRVTANEIIFKKNKSAQLTGEMHKKKDKILGVQFFL